MSRHTAPPGTRGAWTSISSSAYVLIGGIDFRRPGLTDLSIFAGRGETPPERQSAGRCDIVPVSIPPRTSSHFHDLLGSLVDEAPLARRGEMSSFGHPLGGCRHGAHRSMILERDCRRFNKVRRAGPTEGLTGRRRRNTGGRGEKGRFGTVHFAGRSGGIAG